MTARSSGSQMFGVWRHPCSATQRVAASNGATSGVSVGSPKPRSIDAALRFAFNARIIDAGTSATRGFTGSNGDLVIAQCALERDFAVGILATGPDDERTRRAELTGGERLRYRPRDHDAARRDPPAGRHGRRAADVDDRRRCRQHDAGTEDRLTPDP